MMPNRHRKRTTMKPTLRKNGNKMLTVTVKHHLTLIDIAYIFMARYRYDHKNLIRDAQNLPKAKILGKVKDYLFFVGTSTFQDHVYENISKAMVESTIGVFKERFKEFN